MAAYKITAAMLSATGAVAVRTVEGRLRGIVRGPARIEQQTGRKLAEREERRRQERERATQVHEATMAEIGRQNLAKHQELDAEYERRMANGIDRIERNTRPLRDADEISFS